MRLSLPGDATEGDVEIGFIRVIVELQSNDPKDIGTLKDTTNGASVIQITQIPSRNTFEEHFHC